MGAANWKGEKDCSALIYLGHDNQRLYVCMDVTDDQIAIDDKYCFANDGVEFYWDGRPADKRDGKPGIGTGHVILPVPPVGRAPSLRGLWKISRLPKVLSRRRRTGREDTPTNSRRRFTNSGSRRRLCADKRSTLSSW